MKIYKDGALYFESTDSATLESMIESISNSLYNNHYTKSETMSLIASSRAVVQVATMPSSPARNTLYYVGSSSPYNVKLVDSNGTIVDLGSSEVDLTDYVKKTDIATSFSASSTNDKVAGALAAYNSFPPKDSLYICGTYQQLFRSVNDAVFNFDTSGDEIRQIGRKQYCVSNVINPVTGGQVFGFCETEILVNNHNGTGPKVYIYQTVKIMSDDLMIFKRRGTLPGPFDVTTIYENRASINWQAWIPTEYPGFEVARNTTNTTSGVICALITGGILKIELEGIKLATAPGGNMVVIGTLPAGLISALKKWPGSATYFRGSAFNVNSTTSHSGLIQIYKVSGQIHVFGDFVANENIWGSIVAPLGY